MEQIKGGLRKIPSNKPKIKDKDYPEATLEDSEFLDVITKPKMMSDTENKTETGKAPTRIEVKQAQVRNIVPSHVFRCPSFKWHPVTFVTESEQLNQKFIEASKQTTSLEMFIRNPQLPLIYSVAGNPDDAKAKYFAAYLVSIHVKNLGIRANVIWQPLFGGFDNKLVSEADDNESPTLIVITNLSPNSTNLKLEKARDIMERFADIPRIVVSSGLDPISFMTTKLYSQVNALAYFSDSLIRSQMTVI